MSDGWKPVGVRSEGMDWPLPGSKKWPDFSLWRRIGEVHLPHPHYSNQIHRLDIYEIDNEGSSIRFAFGEVSASAYAFYVPAEAA